MLSLRWRTKGVRRHWQAIAMPCQQQETRKPNPEFPNPTPPCITFKRVSPRIPGDPGFSLVPFLLPFLGFFHPTSHVLDSRGERKRVLAHRGHVLPEVLGTMRGTSPSSFLSWWVGPHANSSVMLALACSSSGGRLSFSFSFSKTQTFFWHFFLLFGRNICGDIVCRWRGVVHTKVHSLRGSTRLR